MLKFIIDLLIPIFLSFITIIFIKLFPAWAGFVIGGMVAFSFVIGKERPKP